MKRLMLGALAAAAAALLSVSVLAAGSAKLVRAFVYGDTLYAYVELSDVTQPITKAEARLGSQSFPAGHTLEPVRQAASPVTCMLLVDCSNSMPDFREDVTAFVRELAECSGENTRFLLATFGREFSLIREDLSPQEAAQQVDSIAYTATETRLHSALAAALDYFESLPRENEELRSVVVLSDAVQYDPQGGVSYDEILARISSSDVMLHAVGFGSDAQALDSLGQLVEASQGRHAVVGGELTAQDAARDLADYTGGLLVTGFPIGTYAGTGGTEQLSITFGSGSELVCRAQAEVTLPAGSNAPAEETPPKDSEEAIPPSSASEGTASGEEAAVSGGAGTQAAESAFPSQTLLGAGAGLAVIAGIAAAAVLLRRKKTPPSVPDAPAHIPGDVSGDTPGDAPGVYMRLEVLQGTLSSGQTEFEDVRELTVGKGQACAIAFADAELAEQAAKVTFTQGAVMLEPVFGTAAAVNGQPISGAVRLRSGDEIALDSVRFRLKF